MPSTEHPKEGGEFPQNPDMEISVNGRTGPTMRFNIGVMAAVQAIIALVVFGINFGIFKASLNAQQADVSALKAQIETLKEGDLKEMGNSLQRLEVLMEESRKEQAHMRGLIEFDLRESRRQRERR